MYRGCFRRGLCFLGHRHGSRLLFCLLWGCRWQRHRFAHLGFHRQRRRHLYLNRYRRHVGMTGGICIPCEIDHQEVPQGQNEQNPPGFSAQQRCIKRYCQQNIPQRHLNRSRPPAYLALNLYPLGISSPFVPYRRLCHDTLSSQRKENARSPTRCLTHQSYSGIQVFHRACGAIDRSHDSQTETDVSRCRLPCLLWCHAYTFNLNK